MQAPQSNNASDLLKPEAFLKPEARQDLKPDSAFHRVFPSPFSTPIQAARKYLERQRGEGCEAGTRVPANTEYGRASQASREQDRRLERSLYEGHSIEAGFDFDPAHRGTAGFAAEERAYLVDGNGLESLYRYAPPSPVPDPDPEVVRGAIFRLARESQLRREVLPASGTDSGVNAATNGAEKTVAEPAPTPNFGEVARRVWAAGSGISFANSHVAPESAAGTEAVSEAFLVDEALDGSGEAATSNLARLSQEADLGDRKRQEEIAAGHRAKALFTKAGVAEEAPSLAHDACNLLSGLALYSELLGSPGVLSEPHRHYAEELKLMASRSQLLIERLHRVATARQAEAIPDPPVSAIAQDSSMPDKGYATEEAAVTRDTNRDEERTNLADLLVRWGSLLSVLAQGTLEIVIGSHAAAPIPAGSEALERILVNLIRNARAAIVDGGTIRISVASAVTSSASGQSVIRGEGGKGVGGTMVLTVDDSGCGMTEAQVRRILGDEDEIPAPQTAYGSAGGRQGLGLQIVRELVAASGGTFELQSQLGRGTRVEIRWPVLAAPAVVSHGSPSVATETLVPAAPAEVPVGSDSLREAQLRAMMRRLQRANPEERSPLSRKLGIRRAPGAKETDHRFGVMSSRLLHSDGLEGRQNSSGRNDSSAKGAIAC